MTSKEKQIQNSFIYLIPVILGNFIPLATLPIFTRILTVEDYGALALAQVYAIFITGIANFGLIVGYERNFFEYREHGKTGELLYSTLFFVIITFSVFCCITYFLKSQLALWIIGSSDRADLIFWAYCSTGVVSLKVYYLTYFKNTENAKSFVWYTVDESILAVVFSLFLVVYLKVGVLGLVWGQFLASIIILSILVVKLKKLFSFSFNWFILKESLSLSLPLTPTIFFKVAGNQFDKYMIGLIATTGGVGVYSIGQKVANLVLTYMAAVQNVFSPQVYKRMFDLGDEGPRAVGKYLTPFAYISIFIGLLISLFSEEVIKLLLPVSYYGAIDIISVISIYYCILFFGKQPQLIFTKNTHIISILSILSIILNIVINIPFIYKWGALGAAWGTLVAGLLSTSITFIVSQRYYTILWEYEKLIIIFGIFIIGSILIILTRHLMIGYITRLTIKLIILSLYLFSGIRMRLVSIVNLNLVKNSLMGRFS